MEPNYTEKIISQYVKFESLPAVNMKIAGFWEVTPCTFLVYYLTTLSVLRSYSVYDRMINEYGAAGGMRIGRENQKDRRKSVPVPHGPP
jgi:hypothetical protein